MEGRASIIQELEALVHSIPEGTVASYGQLGRALSRPVSGLLVGRWMAQVSSTVPWWRVVASDGSLPVGKRDPRLGQEQRARLEAEGVPFQADCVAKAAFVGELFASATSEGGQA
jgi:methylated-DNA-protein-cysteine methyltransferase-like protein